MNARLALYGWIARHGVDPERSRALWRLAGFGAEPPALAQRLRSAVAVAAAALGGLGLILWLAANWGDLGRAGRFALLQGALLALCAGAAPRTRARVPCALMALLCIGALFAYFGQTYQTGADPWQLFALWALLALPLGLATRSDVLWAPWALVVSVGLSLWLYAYTGHRWRVEPQDIPAYLLAWLAGAGLVAFLGPLARRATGAGRWALRTAAACVVLLVTLPALAALLQTHVPPHYALAVLLLAAAAAAAALLRRRAFDVFLLSVVALGLDALLVAGAARLLLEDHADVAGRLLVLGLLAAGLLALTVSGITRLVKRHG